MADVALVTRATVLQNYRKLNADVVSGLATLVVGPNFDVHDHTTLAQYNEATGLALPWPGIGAGVADLTTAVVGVTNGVIRYYRDTAAPPTVAQGTWYSTTGLNKITHNSAATVWTGSTFTSALNVPLAIGDFIKLDNGAGVTLYTKVKDFEYITNSPKILVLEDNLPAALRAGGAHFNVIVGQIVTADIPTTYVTLSSTTVTVAPAVLMSTSRTGTAYPLIKAYTYTGGLLSVITVDYRARLATGTFVNDVVWVSTAAEILALIPDYTYQQSVLGFGTARALSPSGQGVTPVRVGMCAPSAETSGAYDTLVTAIKYRNDYSSIALLTLDPTIISKFVTLVGARASLGLHTELFIARDFVQEELVVATYVDINDSLTTGEQRTATAVTGAPFAGAQSGDVLRVITSPGVYTPYVVGTVISAQTLILASPVAGGPLTNQSVELWHPLTTQERIDEFGAAAQSYGNQYVNLIAPTGIQWNATVLDTRLLPSIPAGLRGYAIPQQSLVAIACESGLSSSQSISGQYASQLLELAIYGVFVMASDASTVYVAYGNTTDQSTNLVNREGLVSNAIAVRRFITRKIHALFGIDKVSPTLLDKCRLIANSSCATLRSAVIPNTTYGAVVISYVVSAPYVNPVQANMVVVPISAVIALFIEDAVDFTINVTVG